MRKIMVGVMLMMMLPWRPAMSAGSSASSSSSSSMDTNAAGAFVQDFYDWYAPFANQRKNQLPWEDAVDIKSGLFAKKLLIAFKLEKHAFANPDGTYTGLDSDPFLNTYHPCEHYLAGNILVYEKNYRVAIQPICNGKLQPEPVAFAEVMLKKDHWLFTNFYYPEGQDLLHVLKNLRKQRSDDLD
ncbi:MAG TPA: hypothetical protein VG962_14200 [Steroidobacteraceae bacterium]|nr:hypothetical protein [Steroidobacteraceae bacterium]